MDVNEADLGKMVAMIRAVCEKQEDRFGRLVQEAELTVLLKEITWKQQSMKTEDSPGWSSNLSALSNLDICQIDLDPRVLHSVKTEGSQLVHWVSALGTTGMLDQLLSRNPEVVNSQTRRCHIPPLVFAAEAQNVRLLESLVKGGCDTNAVLRRYNGDEVSEPVLIRLVRNGMVGCAILQSLLKGGSFDVNVSDSQGMTALGYAVITGNLDNVRALLLAGADPNFCQIQPVVDPVLFDSFSAEYDWSESSPRLQIVEALLSSGADPNVPHLTKHAPLYSAVMLDNPSLVEMLLRFGADPDAKSGKTGAPVIYSACRNSFRIVEMLVNANADVNLVDGLGYSALHRASGFGLLETAAILLKNPNCSLELKTTGHQATALNHAAASNNLDILELLLQQDCDVNTTDILGNTPLHYEAMNGCLKGITLLIDRGCDPDKKNVVGASPLWYAVYHERIAISKTLLQQDVDLSTSSQGVKRGQGSRKHIVFNIYHRPQSLLWVAVERGNSELVELLISAGLDIHQERWILTEYSTTENTDETLREYLTDLISRPASLSQLCKNFLLKLSGRNISRMPGILGLPKSIQRYLTFP